MNTKIDEFYAQVSLAEYDLYAITETWLTLNVNNSEFFSDQYTVICCERISSKGGGVLLAVSNQFKQSPLDMSSFSTADHGIDIVGSCISFSSFTLYIIVLYVPPTTNVDSYYQLFEYLELLETIYGKNVLLVGAFNIPSYVNYRNNIEGGKELKCELLNSFLDCFSFVQYNNIVNSNGRLLDLVIANHECIVTRSTPIAREDHHHPALSINLKITQETNSNFEFNNNEVQYNFKRADFLNLYIDFLNIDWNWCNEETYANALCRRFYEEIFRVIERHVPKFKILSGGTPNGILRT
nr:unnamed protein product [Callosobruchus chinensis]